MLKELNCFTKTLEESIPIIPLTKQEFEEWLNEQTYSTKVWIQKTRYDGRAGSYCLIPDDHGKPDKILFGIEHLYDVTSYSILPNVLGEGHYILD